MVGASVSSPTSPLTRESFERENFMVTVKCHGVMAVGTKENGGMEKCMDMAQRSGLMDHFDTKGSGARDNQYGSKCTLDYDSHVRSQTPTHRLCFLLVYQYCNLKSKSFLLTTKSVLLEAPEFVAEHGTVVG